MRSVDTWVELFLSEQGFARSGGPWPEHVAGWWAERHRPDVLALRYEVPVADLPGGIGQLADLMGVDLDPDALESCLTRDRAHGHDLLIGSREPLNCLEGRHGRHGRGSAGRPPGSRPRTTAAGQHVDDPAG